VVDRLDIIGDWPEYSGMAVASENELFHGCVFGRRGAMATGNLLR
jgi:hypothetical protein